jgi:3-dehydroquinate synthase
MGSGKTTLGRALATRLRRYFFDSDEQLEEQYAATGRELAATRGVPGLHRLERMACATALASSAPAVIAAAASIADDGAFLRSMTSEGHVLVYLLVADRALEALATGEQRRPVSATEARELEPERRDNALRAEASVFPVDHDRPLQESVDLLARQLEPHLGSIR